LNLYLLRHAKSSWESYEDDHDRVLSERGRNDASTLGEYLHKNNINFENTLCSSSQRTRETVSIINEASPHSIDEINYLDSLYHATSNKIKEIVQKCSNKSLLIVGHNPGVSELISDLLKSHFVDYPTCVFAQFKLTSHDDACARAQMIIRPKEKKIINLM
tara:strand:- start:173 stop:655 length:483 start_codon:yes stop_codon:yes gene_type:complete